MKSKKQVTNGNGNNQQSQSENQLKQHQVPDSTNKSTGVPGTGQRQDSN